VKPALLDSTRIDRQTISLESLTYGVKRMARPDALGAEIAVASLDDADRVLHELSWLANEQARLDALAKQKIDEIKKDFGAKAVVEIDGELVTFEDRVAALTAPLNEWVTANIAEHLPAKKKSLELPHGTLGLRQQPVVAEFGQDETKQSILDRIDQTTGLVTHVNGILARNVSTLGKSVQGRDLLKIEVSPATKQMQEAVEAKRLTAEQLAEFGLFLRDAYDEAVVKPAKVVVS
jgi:phage host-nuclease inhibitor protein Gam